MVLPNEQGIGRPLWDGCGAGALASLFLTKISAAMGKNDGAKEKKGGQTKWANKKNGASGQKGKND